MATRPAPLPGPPGGPSPGRRAGVIAAVVAGTLVLGLVAWKAGDVFGGSSGDDAGSSPSASSVYSSDAPTPSDSGPAVPASDLPSYTPSYSPSDSGGTESLSGRWDGNYTCNQGITGLSLTIEQHVDGTADAVFSFYPAPSNPGVPRGSFAMKGTVTGRLLSLRASRWIDRPSNFDAVNLSAVYDTSTPDQLKGLVLGGNCSTFSTERS